MDIATTVRMELWLAHFESGTYDCHGAAKKSLARLLRGMLNVLKQQPHQASMDMSKIARMERVVAEIENPQRINLDEITDSARGFLDDLNQQYRAAIETSRAQQAVTPTDGLREKNSELENKVNSLKTEIATLKNNNALIESHLKTATSTVDTLKTLCDTSNAELPRLRQLLEKSGQREREASERCKQAEIENTRLKIELRVATAGHTTGGTEKLNAELNAAKDQRDAYKKELQARPEQEDAEMSETTKNARLSTLTAQSESTHQRKHHQSAVGCSAEFQRRLENDLRSFMEQSDIFLAPAAKHSREDADE